MSGIIEPVRKKDTAAARTLGFLFVANLYQPVKIPILKIVAYLTLKDRELL